tara:strand:- start:3818 stop:4708 length:891 start_codon:yes stop_codon:yes gene_type:complete
MEKIIYEYDLDKIFISETVEKFSQLDGSLIVPQFYTEIKPVFNGDTHFAMFDEGNQSWQYKKLAPLGIFYHKQNMAKIDVKDTKDINYFVDLYTNIQPPIINDGDNIIFDDQLQAWKYINKGSQTLAIELKALVEKKLKEIRANYELSQQILMKNGKTILIRIMGTDYSDLQREFNKSSWTKDKLATINFKNLLDQKRYKIVIPRSFGKHLLAKIQEVSADNYFKKEVALQKIETNTLTLEQLSVLKVDFIFNSEINIDTEATSYINDDYYKTKYPQDVEFIIKCNKNYFIELNAK